MVAPDMGKHNDYARFAAFCLNQDAELSAPSNPIQREMALVMELADAALHPVAAS